MSEPLEHALFSWNQQGRLKTKSDATQCYIHVYGCDQTNCRGVHEDILNETGTHLSTKGVTEHSPAHFVGTYPIAAQEGHGIVHVTGSKCGFGMLAGCGWISYDQKSKCAHAATVVSSHQESPTDVAEEVKQGTVVDGDSLLLIQRKQGRSMRSQTSLLETCRKGIDGHSKTLGVAPLASIQDAALDAPQIEDNALHSTMKREMLGRDIVTVEAWLNATSGRASLERENAKRIKSGLDVKGLNNVYDAEAIRSSRVVRCLNLARGTEVFALLKKS